jgi:hypothetical protein
MDFFERWFGWSPDGGDGTTEMFYIGIVAALVVTLTTRAYYKRKRTREQRKIRRDKPATE